MLLAIDGVRGGGKGKSGEGMPLTLGIAVKDAWLPAGSTNGMPSSIDTVSVALDRTEVNDFARASAGDALPDELSVSLPTLAAAGPDTVQTDSPVKRRALFVLS